MHFTQTYQIKAEAPPFMYCIIASSSSEYIAFETLLLYRLQGQS